MPPVTHPSPPLHPRHPSPRTQGNSRVTNCTHMISSFWFLHAIHAYMHTLYSSWLAPEYLGQPACHVIHSLMHALVHFNPGSLHTRHPLGRSLLVRMMMNNTILHREEDSLRSDRSKGSKFTRGKRAEAGSIFYYTHNKHSLTGVSHYRTRP